PAPDGFEPWLLKFDGVNQDTLGDPEGFGRVEYAYYLMALDCGIDMSTCRLLKEGGRAHFMTHRFDRGVSGEKKHMLSLCAMSHYDFNRPGDYSYEQALGIIQKLNIGQPAMQELYRRMVFNILARNHDDHTRNIAFLMDRKGNWRLAPAYDMMWSHKTDSPWVSRHQMRVNGKQDNFTYDDIKAVADHYMIKNAKELFRRVHTSISRWKEFADQAEVDSEMMHAVGTTHRIQDLNI
ncbi:type II toxin-antitoxin system HipA family toxin, partial [Candidatus Latescibacterota bacterium]